MPNFMFWALAAANANPGPRTPTSPDAMATAPVVIAGTYVDAIQPVVVSGMPLAGATPEQQQMPVVVAGTYVRAQSRELARGIGSVQRGIARQLSGASSTRRLSGGTSSTPLPAPTERTEAASDAPGGGVPLKLRLCKVRTDLLRLCHARLCRLAAGFASQVADGGCCIRSCRRMPDELGGEVLLEARREWRRSGR